QRPQVLPPPPPPHHPLIHHVPPSRPHRDVHHYPTRRSSDLRRPCAAGAARRPDARPVAARAAHGGAGSVLPPHRASAPRGAARADRKSTRLNSSHLGISYAVFCLKKKT